MFLKILTAFIILFVVMLVIGLIRGKGRTKASAGDAARETRKLQSFDDMIAEYEREPDHGSITEDQYYYCCYMTGKKINGYDLKKSRNVSDYLRGQRYQRYRGYEEYP